MFSKSVCFSFQKHTGSQGKKQKQISLHQYSWVWVQAFSSFIRVPEPRGLHQHPLPWLLDLWNRELNSNLSVVPVDHTKPAPAGSSQTELGRLVSPYMWCPGVHKREQHSDFKEERPRYLHTGSDGSSSVWAHRAEQLGTRCQRWWISASPKAYALEACSSAQGIIGRWWDL